MLCGKGMRGRAESSDGVGHGHVATVFVSDVVGVGGKSSEASRLVGRRAHLPSSGSKPEEWAESCFRCLIYSTIITFGTQQRRVLITSGTKQRKILETANRRASSSGARTAAIDSSCIGCQCRPCKCHRQLTLSDASQFGFQRKFPIKHYVKPTAPGKAAPLMGAGWNLVVRMMR